MKLSIHYTKGKSTSPNVLQEMGSNWVNIDVSWAEAFELITVDGYASSAELLADHRIGKDFVSRQLIMVDVDNDPDKDNPFLTLLELLEHPFYTAYGAGFYATHSFKPEQHRYRICFVLENPETDHKRCRNLIRGLLKIFPAGDHACKDPVRLFYGSPNCVIKERTDNIVPQEIVDALVNGIESEDAEIASAMTRAGPPPVLTTGQRRKILELLKQTFVGDYHIWRNVGWGLKAGGFTLPDFQYVTAGLMRLKTPEQAAAIWMDGKQVSGGVTMGSVVYLLKQHHGDNCLSEKQDWRGKREELYNKYK